MYRSLVAALSAVLLALPSTRAADDDAKAVIAKAIKAHGGEDALAKYKAGTATSKGKIDLPGLGEVEFTQQLAFMLPDKIKDEMEITVNGQAIKIVSIANGNEVSIEAAGNKVDVNDEIKASFKDAMHMMTVTALVALVKEKGYELSVIGEVKVADKPAVGVRVVKKDQKDINLFFDKQTNLLVKVERRTVVPGGGNEVNEERVYSDYKKDKNGVMLPRKIVVNHDGKKFLEAEVTEAEAMEKLDDSVFKK